MAIVELYDKLKKHFLENGYVISRESERGLEAMHPQKGMVFDQMMEGEYLESSLHQVSNELLVQYDIFTGEFSHDLFIDNPENERLAKEWQSNLENEVVQLGLKDFAN